MDIQLYYEEYGTGEHLVLLHGNNEDSSYFVHQIEYFQKQYHVIAVDTRGHGKSPRGKAPFTFIQFAKDLKEFLDEHGWKKIHLLGFSDGGNIAVYFALMYPEYVDRLILNGANLHPDGVKKSVQIPTCFSYIQKSFLAGFSKKALKDKEMLGLMVKQPNLPVHVLKRIPNQTLVIAGKQDMIKESHTRAIAKMIPNGRLCIIEGDHFIAKKEPEKFNKIIEKFLKLEERNEI